MKPLIVQFLCLGCCLVHAGDVVRVETTQDFDYVYLQDYGVDIVGQTDVQFTLKATNDGHVALSNQHAIWKTDSYEIVIGGWHNQKSAIRQCDQCNAKVTVDHRPLNGSEFRPFWISWAGGLIQVGSGSTLFENEIMNWLDPQPHVVNYIGVSTGWDANGTWVFGFIDGEWSEWASWSSCNRTCGGGWRYRLRQCDNPPPSFGIDCVGVSAHEEMCETQECPIDGGWSAWSEWTACSLTCERGTRTRTRFCVEPPPQFDGEDCEGHSDETVSCMERDCPVHGGWSEWTDWGPCSTSCEEGTETRWRNCSNPTPMFGGESCIGVDIDVKQCFLRGCPVDGRWSEWSTWGACSMSCGHGNQVRARACDDPAPLNDGQNCTGPSLEEQECEVAKCPVDGAWSDWSAWSECSRTCASGSYFRTRSCTDPSPENGGSYCPGDEKEKSDCSVEPCPIDGGWSSWEEWSTCSTTCGDGITTRYRLCDNPSPAHNGANCSSSDLEDNSCKIKECPVNGGWSEWGNWSECSRTCGEGYTTRYRYCSNPAPAHGGSNCTGDYIETFTCWERPCSIDGSWTTWSEWAECSVTCGYGQTSRERNCSNPPPQENGKWCEGHDNEEQSCKDAFCPIDGGWTLWTMWSTCSKTCGGGHRARTRFCGFPQPEHGGDNCTTGDPLQNVTCNFADCPVAKEDQPPEEEPVEAPGAVGIGIIGLGMVCALLGAVIILDLATIHRHFIFMRRNLEHFWKKTGVNRASTRRSKYTEGVDSENNLEEGFENNAYSPSPTSNEFYENSNRSLKRLPRHNIDGEEETFMNIENNLNTNDRKDFDANYTSKGMDKYSDLELKSTRL